MKKFVIVMLVFGMASLANADTVSLMYQGDPLAFFPGATITIDVVSDYPVASAVMNLELSTTAADYGTAALGAWNPGFDNLPMPGLLCNQMSGSRYILIDRISAGTKVGSPPVTGLLYSFDFTIPLGAVYGDTYVISGATGTPVVHAGPPYGNVFMPGNVPLSPVTLCIPEPVTIALLGLGGLLLRRRK